MRNRSVCPQTAQLNNQKIETNKIMSFATKPLEDQENLALQHGRVRQELMRLRSAKTREPEAKLDAYKWDRSRYDLIPIGKHDPSNWTWPIDPNRRVASHWKKLSFEGTGHCLVFESDGTLENFDLVEGTEGVLKVRWIKAGMKTGAVENLSIMDYFWARAGAFSNRNDPNCEPVDDAEPLCPAWRPPEVTSAVKKAKETVAKALKKNSDQLTVNEVVAYFDERTSKGEKAIAAIHEAVSK